MIGQWADWVNGLVATVSIAADASQEVSGSHDVVTIIAVSALAAMALQDLILAVVRRLVDVIKVMKSVVISARSDGFSVDLEAREASSMRLLPTSWRTRDEERQDVAILVDEDTGDPETIPQA